jgi:4-amino-4-deoxychorismate lyase
MLWIDGRQVADAAPLDRGLEFGDGLFETMAVVNGRVRLLARHLDRLTRGCERLRLAMPDLDALRAQIQMAAATPEAGVIKVIVTRGVGGVGYAMPRHGSPHVYVVASPARRAAIRPGIDGARVVCLPTPISASPRLAGLKHLNRLEQVLLRDDVAQLGVDEGLVTDASGHLISGAMTNVFLVIDDTVVTPALDRCGIDGVMRNAVVDYLRQHGKSVTIRDVALSECGQASELFLTNALMGVWPVIELDGRALPVGPWARQLQTVIASWAD